MSAFIIAFCSVQVSLVLHNENLRAAIRAHWQFIRRELGRVSAGSCSSARLHFFFLTACDAIVRGAIADRVAALICLEDDLRLRPRTRHRLAPRLVGLFVPAMRDRADRSGNWIQY